jgi:hypothetical protein
MDVDDHRQRAGGARAGRVRRGDDTDPDIAGRRGHRYPLLADVGLGDLARLDLIDGLAAGLRAEVKQVRRVGGSRGELGGGGLEDWCRVAHDLSPSRAAVSDTY